MRLTRWSLATQLLLLVGSVLLLTTTLVLLLAIVQARFIIQDDVIGRNAVLTDAASQLVAAPLANSDRADVERTLSVVVRDEGLARASVLDAAGTLVASAGEAAPEDPADFAQDMDFARAALHDGQRRSRSTEEHFDLAVPITRDGRTLGIMVGESDFEAAADKVDTAIPQMVAASQLDAPLPMRRSGEIGALTTAFQQMVNDLRTARADVMEQHNTLEARVAERTTELERTLTEHDSASYVIAGGILLQRSRTGATTGPRCGL